MNSYFLFSPFHGFYLEKAVKEYKMIIKNKKQKAKIHWEYNEMEDLINGNKDLNERDKH